MADRADAVAGVVHRQDAAQSRPWKSRADRGELLKPHLRADGVLLAEAVVLRECVLEYTAPDGSTFRELVPLKTITDSAEQIAHLPITLGHPAEKITDDTLSDVMVGNVYSDEVLVADGGYTHVRIAVRKKAAKDAIDKGTKELSLGYDAQVDPTPGVHPDHGRYDGIQVARSYANGGHLAIVDAARVGPEARINLDGARFDGVSTTTFRADSAPNTPGRKATGVTVTPGLIPILSLLGITRRIDSDDAAHAAIESALRARKDAEEAMAEKAVEEEAAADAEASKLQAALDTATQSLAAVQAELDALKGEVAVEADKADRAALLPLATALKVDAAAAKSTKDLRRAIATAHLGGTLRADAADAYVDALVDLAQTAMVAKGDGREAGSKAWVQPQGDQHSDSQQSGQPLLTANQKAAARIAARAGGAK